MQRSLAILVLYHVIATPPAAPPHSLRVGEGHGELGAWVLASTDPSGARAGLIAVYGEQLASGNWRPPPTSMSGSPFVFIVTSTAGYEVSALDYIDPQSQFKDITASLASKQWPAMGGARRSKCGDSTPVRPRAPRRA